MSLTAVNVTRDEEGNVVAHWTGTVSFHPSVYAEPGTFATLISECVEDFERELQAEINQDFAR